MALPSRPRPDLEKFIPKSILDNVQRECPRPQCRSENVIMRYFNNNKYDQPRFFCNACKRLFTLGGKLRESYKKAKNKTEEATTNTRTSNLHAEGVETGESSGLARWTQTKTRSSRQGLSLTTNHVASGIETRTKSIDEDDEETEDSKEEIEEEMEEEIESKSEDRDLFPLDLNKTPHYESNLANEDEEMHQAEEFEQLAEETEELDDLDLPREGNEDCIPTEEVLGSTAETPMRAPMVLDATVREEPGMLSKAELLRKKAQKHLLAAQVTLEEVFIEKSAMLLELQWKEIEQRRERENRDLYMSEEMLHALKQEVVKVVSSWLVGPLNGARYEMLAAREASLEKVGRTVESLIREVREMENALVPHATMVKIEKKAKRLWDRVVALTD